MKFIKTAALLLTACLGSILFAQQAPAFTLTDTNGTEHSLSDFAGKTVVLEWFNAGCPFVQKHYSKGNMQNLQSTYTEEGVVWLTVVSSAPGKQGHGTAAEHNSKMEQWKMQPTAMLIDEDGSVGKAYDAKVTPHMYIINSEGEIVYNGAIDSKRSTNPEDIPNSTNYVKEALDAVLAGEPVAVARTQPYGCSVKY
jgi:peroxiredoxin